jgi:hypothetical protein
MAARHPLSLEAETRLIVALASGKPMTEAAPMIGVTREAIRLRGLRDTDFRERLAAAQRIARERPRLRGPLVRAEGPSLDELLLEIARVKASTMPKRPRHRSPAPGYVAPGA